MKKLLCLTLVLVLSMCVFTACKNNAKDTAKPENTVSQNETAEEEQKESEVPTKEDTSKNDNSFYLILNGTNEESVLYHKGDCPLLKDKEIQKTSWEMIEMLQFRHCAKCNPPKYKGYVE